MLSEKEFYKKLDIYNFICVSSMFLNKTKFGKVEDCDLKKEVRGHYGTTPSLNFTLIALDEFCKTCKYNVNFILGTGHAGLSLLVHNYINGELSKNDLSLCFNTYYEQNEVGLNNFIREFGEEVGYRSEASPFIPNTIYDGDELGYALSVSFGSVWNRPNDIVFCFVGDGEFETGTAFSSFILNRAMRAFSHGVVVPIINLNGFRMGKQSNLSTFSKSDITNFFGALNYKVYFACDYSQMQEFLHGVEGYLSNREGKCPLLILNIPKGSFAPVTDKVNFAGKSISHKNPLGSYDRGLYAEYLTTWLNSYNVTLDDILNTFNKKAVFCGSFASELIYKPLVLPDISVLEFVGSVNNSNANAFSYYCNKLIDNNLGNFLLLSPDELTSNKCNIESKYANNCFEILNENICQGILQGVLATGRNGIICAYEGFMPIVTSMLSQYCKYLYQCSLIGKVMPSLNYAITSVVWENCYSHQNPEIINSLNNKHYNFISTYFPLDANMMLICLNEMMKSHNQINLLVYSKRNKKQYFTLKDAEICFINGYSFLQKSNNSNALIIALGDTMADVATDNNFDCDIIYICKLQTLKNKNVMQDIFSRYKNVVILFHGYKSLVQSIIWDYELNCNIKIYGYEDKSITSGFLDYKLKANDIDIDEIKRFLKG